jgi:hypothetical protein
MSKADTFSRPYEKLDQELKNACLRYEQAVAKKGLKLVRISLTYTPNADPFFDIDVDEEPKIKRTRNHNPTIPPPPKLPSACTHSKALCDGQSRIECLLCDEKLGDCPDPACERCQGKDVEDPPSILPSGKFPIVPEEDEEDELELAHEYHDSDTGPPSSGAEDDADRE